MELKSIHILGKIAGIGGIALGVMAVLFREILKNVAFQILPTDKSYQIILIMTIGLFIIGVLGMILWFFSNSKNSPKNPERLSKKIIAKNGSVALGDDAKNNTITVNNKMDH